jgi:photosystem II stability/assembly factor-like uncharacterized protein
MNTEKLIIIFAIIISISAVSNAFADDNNWTSNGPDGGSVYTIAIHPINNQILYIGTIQNGIYKSTNGGMDWVHLDSDSLYEIIRVIRIHPLGRDTIYASTVEGAYKSINSGETWSHFGPALITEFRAFAIHPKNPAIMLLGGLGMIYKTTDGGNSWSDTITNQVGQDIEFALTDSNLVYRATQNPFDGHSIYRSYDIGESWQCIHNDFDSAGVVYDMAVDPVNPQIIYLAEHAYLDSTARCMSKTTNGGQHWLDITPPNMNRPFVHSITISPFDHNTIFICTNADGVFKSADAGQTWQAKNQGLNINQVARIVIDSSAGILYLGTFYDGIYRSTNNGDDWEKISYNMRQAACMNIAMNARNPDSIYLATAGGIYRSIDGNLTWDHIDLNLPNRNTVTSYVSFDQDPRYIYVGISPITLHGGYGGFVRSTNAGTSWELISDSLLSGRAAEQLAVSYNTDSSKRIFFASDSGLFYSDDIGLSWNICQGGLPVFECSAFGISPVDNNLIFISSFYPSLFYKSTDRGDTWNQISDIPSSYWSQFIKCDPVDRNIVYADFGLNIGLYKSTDGGIYWFDTNNNLPRDEHFYQISGLDINRFNNNELYINTYHKGVFVSYDGGTSWNPFNGGLPKLYDYSNISIDPLDTSKIFMATYGASVWSIHRTIEGIDDENPNSPMHVSLFSNYPNPFNAQTTIKYALPAPANVTIDIFDIAGRKVETLLSTYQSAGEHSAIWNAGNNASGIYFYRLKSGENSRVAKCIFLK